MRITTTIVDQHIDLVKTVAERAGLTYINYSRATWHGLTRYSANGTHQLVATVEGTSGTSEIGYARGLRGMYDTLQGMYVALDSITRHNSDNGKA